jgi:hypothetical protein
LGTPALRRIEWELPLPAIAGGGPPGRELKGSLSPRLVLTGRRRHHFGTKNILEHPPQRHVRKKLVSLHRTTAIDLEWIALGLTEKSFWTVHWRWISELESQARFTMNFARLDRVRMGV